jgi:hypothetical protein
MELKGVIGIEYLKNGKVKIRDKVLVGIKLSKETTITNIELLFADGEIAVANVIIELKDVKLFDFYYDEDTHCIVDYKIFYDETNDEYYLSLDPDDSIIDKSVDDRGIIKAKDFTIKTFEI